jgi:hypothetical protein
MTNEILKQKTATTHQCQQDSGREKGITKRYYFRGGQSPVCVISSRLRMREADIATVFIVFYEKSKTFTNIKARTQGQELKVRRH